MTAAVHALPGLLAAEKARDLPVPPIVFGLGAFVALCVLLLIVLSFGRDR